jgi:DNA-binding MarR family transcriptional regulator
MDIELSFVSATIEYASKYRGRRMTSQVLSEQSVAVESFVALVRASAHATRHLSALLTADHGLTISDYEVLLRLSRAPDRRMRRVDLAEEVLLTASGITRLLDGLERSGYVERGSCDSDRRVVYAVLTDEGHSKLRNASESHVAQIEDYFNSRYDDAHLVELNGLLARIELTNAGDCAPDLT